MPTRHRRAELALGVLCRGRILGPALVIGDLVFFSTLEGRTYAARITDGKIVWRFRAGKYSPGIATEKRYYLSLNGLLAAFVGTSSGTG